MVEEPPTRLDDHVGATIVATLSPEVAELLGGPTGADTSQTMRLGAVADARIREGLEVTDESSDSIEMPVPVEVRRMRPRRRPLIAIVAIGMAAFAALTVAMVGPDTALPSVDASSWDPSEAVELAAYDGTLGLTDENKEVVLTLCFQLSRRPNTECRLSHLRELGEYPARTVRLQPFAIDRFEVANRDWQACVAAAACAPRALDECTLFSVARGRELRTEVPESMGAPELPAGCVNYAEAEAYCGWRGGRLPTAEEWERAARSGDDRLQPWGPFALPGLLNWGERILRDFPIPGRVDGFELTAPVDSYRSGTTDDGIYNLLGNVAEWVQPMPDDGADVGGVRGGSYVTEFQDLRATFHRVLPLDQRRTTIGFRCVYPR